MKNLLLTSACLLAFTAASAQTDSLRSVRKDVRTNVEQQVKSNDTAAEKTIRRSSTVKTESVRKTQPATKTYQERKTKSKTKIKSTDTLRTEN